MNTSNLEAFRKSRGQDFWSGAPPDCRPAAKAWSDGRGNRHPLKQASVKQASLKQAFVIQKAIKQATAIGDREGKWEF